ncbi:hypothetical protein SAMN04488018_12217 [Myroides marinus]|uniref:Polysaccharide deacetylase n=1 Tax=Myroides marinus TaxID=703342 RepID=A0A1H6XJB8_9FLAO|nr:DUF2334 domain-containing protein [Myroides marinus]SEJ29189.1 hypothetical protein SAMN04488018_12217 [Myroides marinus]
MRKYIVRFDDLCPTMDWNKFSKIKEALEEYGIKSVLGVVPINRDPVLNIADNITEEMFYHNIIKFKNYGDTIAQHGTYHIMHNCSGGIMKINKYGEICELPYNKQLELLTIGKQILVERNIWEPYYMAPAHSFDDNTLKALKELNFLALTDGWGGYPYQLEDIICVPQLFAKPFTKFNIGYQTICLHTNNMNKFQIEEFVNFIHSNKGSFVNFKDIVANKDLLKPSITKFMLYNVSKFTIPIIRSIRK